MQKILIVEDTKFFARVLSTKLEKTLDLPIIVAKNMAEAKTILDGQKDDVTLALLDLNLPDAPSGEIVDYVHSKSIPVIVFTALMDDDIRESILAKGVIDYVLKDNPSSVDYMVSLVKRIINNRKLTALVVDDSSIARKLYTAYLGNYQFTVLSACDGIEAMQIINDNKTHDGNNISLVMTDFTMPNMDGCELIREIRKEHPKDTMVIIGVSAQGNNMLSAKFIKTGANDFITKPFYPEELLCRVTQNMDTIEHLHELKMMASYDYLTGLGNRRLFFDLSTPILAIANRNKSNIALAMLDIDHFKHINDTYGHDVGDEVLKTMSGVLKDSMQRGTDILSRMGGEEFAIVFPDMDPDNLPDYLDNVRKAVEALSFNADGQDFKITISIGAVNKPGQDVQAMLKEADEMLYQSKENGRNQVTISQS